MGSMNGSCSLMIFLIIGAALLTLNPVAAKLDWRTCGSSLPKACGEAIGQRVKSNRGSPVSDNCCIALVKIGKPCHDAFIREHIKSHDYKGRTYLIVKRSEKVWDDCVEVAKFVFPHAEAPKSS